MSKNVLFMFTFIFIIINCCSRSTDTGSGEGVTTPSGNDYQVNLNFKGPTVNHSTAYTCWIEDESGTNLHNIYVCNRIVGIGGALTGDALPYWKTIKYPMNNNVDGVTGASIQGDVGLNVTRVIDFGSAKRFRVCFEIDRSLNSNDYFGDRPSFIYRSDVINLDSLQPTAYSLSLYAWMANGTTGTYSQQPITGVTITNFKQYRLMTDATEDNIKYIKDTSGSISDMVNSLTAGITKN